MRSESPCWLRTEKRRCLISWPPWVTRFSKSIRELSASEWHPQARLIPTGKRPADSKVGARVLTVEDYIQGAQPYFEKNGFFEREVAGRREEFGNIAHVFSTYESRHARDEKPFQRGINSIQLFHDGTRWWVLTIMWDAETPEHPIPPQYLK